MQSTIVIMEGMIEWRILHESGKGGNSGYEFKWIEETTQGSTVGLTTSEVYWLLEVTLIKGDC